MECLERWTNALTVAADNEKELCALRSEVKNLRSILEHACEAEEPSWDGDPPAWVLTARAALSVSNT